MINNREIDGRFFNEINEIENWLYNFKGIIAAIENLQLELEYINGDLTSKDHGQSSKTNKFNSEVENTLLKKELLIQRLMLMKTKINQIRIAINILNSTERKIIENFYIGGKKYYEFTYKIGYSERSVKRIKKIALSKIILAMKGILPENENARN